jgi:hypothetical protein
MLMDMVAQDPYLRDDLDTPTKYMLEFYEMFHEPLRVMLKKELDDPLGCLTTFYEQLPKMPGQPISPLTEPSMTHMAIVNNFFFHTLSHELEKARVDPMMSDAVMMFAVRHLPQTATVDMNFSAFGHLRTFVERYANSVYPGHHMETALDTVRTLMRHHQAPWLLMCKHDKRHAVFSRQSGWHN